MARKKRGPQSQLAAGMYALNQRRVQAWIPFLEEKVKALQARVEQKQDAAKQGQRAG
jgi:hypothetical protein